MLPLAEYRPDIAEWNGAYSSEMRNVIPTGTGYGPHPSFVPLESLGALPAQQRGQFVARKQDGSYVFFAATATKLYRANFVTGVWDDVSEAGSDQALTGDFASDTNWSKDTGITIAGGKLVFTSVGDGDGASQSQTLTAGITYKITFTVESYSAGGVIAKFTGGTEVAAASVGANGTNTVWLTAVTGNNAFELTADGTTTLNVDNVSIVPLTTYSSVPSDDVWDFAQFGTSLLATNQSVNLQVFNVESGANFAEAADYPTKARHITIVGDFVVAYGLVSDERTIAWSNINDAEDWTAGGGSLADSQTFPDDGAVSAVTTEEAGFVLQEEGIRRMIFLPGDLSVFRFEKTGVQRGLRTSWAWAQHGANVYYYSDDGFYRIGPDGSAPIGKGRVNITFAKALDASRQSQMQMVADPVQTRIYIAGPTSSDADFLFSNNLIYDWAFDEFVPVGCTISGRPAAAVAPGTTLEGLDALFATLEDVTPSLDSSVWQAGAPVLAAFCGVGRRIGTYSGGNLEATLETPEVAPFPGRRTLLHSVRPLVDTTAGDYSIGVRNRPADALYWFTGYTVNTSGLVPCRGSGQGIRVKHVIPADTEWTHHTGYVEDIEEDGDR